MPMVREAVPPLAGTSLAHLAGISASVVAAAPVVRGCADLRRRARRQAMQATLRRFRPSAISARPPRCPAGPHCRRPVARGWQWHRSARLERPQGASARAGGPRLAGVLISAGSPLGHLASGRSARSERPPKRLSSRRRSMPSRCPGCHRATPGPPRRPRGLRGRRSRSGRPWSRCRS